MLKIEIGNYKKIYSFIKPILCLFLYYVLQITIAILILFLIFAIYYINQDNTKIDFNQTLQDVFAIYNSYNNVFYIIILLSSLIIFFFILRTRWREIKYGVKCNHLKIKNIFLLAFLGFSIGMFIGLLINISSIREPFLQNITYKQNIDILGFVFRIIGIIVIAPISEELVFRSVLMRGLQVAHSPFLAIIVSSLIFGFIHGSIIQFIYASFYSML